MRHFSAFDPDYKPTKTRVHFSISRKIGLDDVRISMTSTCDIGDERAELGRLQQEGVNSLTDYINVAMLDTPSLPASSLRANDRLTIKVTRFECTYENKMKKVKALSPEYPKFGVIVFDEVLESIGLTKDDISLEHGMDFDPPLNAVVLIGNEGKPRKIVQLKREQ